MADPTRLYVRPTNTTHPLEMKFDIFHDVGGRPTRVNLCGFSYFGEVNGRNLFEVTPTNSKGIDLVFPGDPVANVQPPKYNVTVDDYLNKLRGARVNFTRVFLFNEYHVRFYPFAGSFATKFKLEQVNPVYLARLRSFVSRARARGIVVCISLFSSQMLRQHGFAVNPFNILHNRNDLIRNPDGSEAGIGRNEFCKIAQPPGQPSPYNHDWTQPQRLWWIQHNLVKEIVNATKEFWNVTYEIFNEPAADFPEIVSWHKKVATWLKDLLWEPVANRRSRLVFVNAADNILDGLINTLLPAGQPPLCDVFSFHGGGGNLPSQWGGPHGRGPDSVCAIPTPPNVGQIISGADETLPNGQVIHHRGIGDAFRRLRERPVVQMFDTDAQYWAQKNVTPYVEEVLNIDGSYNYRWGEKYLNAVNDANCADLQPLRLGLDQRLAKIAAARNRERITIFPV